MSQREKVKVRGPTTSVFREIRGHGNRGGDPKSQCR